MQASTSDEDDWLRLDELPQPKAPPPIPVPDEPAVPVPRPSDESYFRDLPGDLTEDSAGGASQDWDDFTSQVEPPPRPPAAPRRPPAPTPAPAPVPGSPAPRPPKAPAATPTEYASEYRVKCRVCESVTYAKASQAGKSIICHDCGSPIKVPPPPKLRQAAKLDLDAAPTFNLGKSISDRRRDEDPMRKSARQLLEEAERDEPEVKTYRGGDVPDVGQYLAGIFGIFRDLSVITHWVGLSLVGGVPAAIMAAIDMPMLYYVVLPIGVVFGAAVISSAFAILQAVANHEQRVKDWPIFDPPTWLGELLFALAAAAVVAVPMAVLSHLLQLGLLGVAMTMFAIYALFPFVLLSMMDLNTAWQPFSAEVARSVTRCEDAWGGVYLTSAMLFGIVFLIVITAQSFGMGPGGALVVTFAFVGATFIYFAMIGRLAYQIGQDVHPPRSGEDAEDAEEASERPRS